MPRSLYMTAIKKAFGPVQALDGASLTVGAGEFVSFLGPSGCGKTTLLRIIAGFEKPDAGEIRLGDERLDTLPPYRRPVGMLFQSLALFPHLSVGGNVAFGLAVRGEAAEIARRKVSAALDLVELGGFEDRRIHQLSGGQRQRVALARALSRFRRSISSSAVSSRVSSGGCNGARRQPSSS
jgi:ABC-type Fe3+/spermidine/putrescine transport system ATPase subunit